MTTSAGKALRNLVMVERSIAENEALLRTLELRHGSVADSASADDEQLASLRRAIYALRVRRDTIKASLNALKRPNST